MTLPEIRRSRYRRTPLIGLDLDQKGIASFVSADDQRLIRREGQASRTLNRQPGQASPSDHVPDAQGIVPKKDDVSAVAAEKQVQHDPWRPYDPLKLLSRLGIPQVHHLAAFAVGILSGDTGYNLAAVRAEGTMPGKAR